MSLSKIYGFFKMSFNIKIEHLIMLVLGLVATSLVLAQTYEPGHQALQIWNEEAMANSPEWVKIWLYIMLASFALGLLFVWKRVEARWVVGGFILALAISTWVLPALNLVILSGLVALVHLICWTPALYMLLSRRTFTKERSFYAVWCGWITLVIIFSFVFDVRDAAIYLGHLLSN